MSVEIIRTGWLPLYEEGRDPNMFLSRHFTVKRGGIYDGGKIAIDIKRGTEKLAIAIKRCTGPNLNDIDIFTTKEFEPPSYGEAFPVDVCDLINRMAGVDPFTDAYNGYVASLMAKLTDGFIEVGNKIGRSVEFQASQIMQTGTMTLVNSAGDTVYEIDFSPKASHFPQNGVTAGYGPAWSSLATATPYSDIQALARTIRADGKVDPDKIIFGEGAFDNFISNDEVKARLDNRRYELGVVDPRFADSGATFQGTIAVGNYRFEMWTYPDTYEDPVSGLPVDYVSLPSMIMLSSRTRFDMTSARVPLPLGPDPRVAALMPGRMSSRANGFDVTPNLYPTENGKQIMGELESRPLLLPIGIDGFGCLTTE